MSDNLSFAVRFVTKACGGAHPIRLAILFGFATIIRFFVKVSIKYYPDAEIVKVASELSFYEIALMLIPLLFWQVIWGGKGAPEAAVQQVSTIDLLVERSGLSEGHKSMLWRALINKYLGAVNPDLGNPPDLQAVYEETKSEISPDITS